MTTLPELIDQSLASRRLLRRGQRLLVAVSGGVDSMVLLDVLHNLASQEGWQLTVAHLNHQLRGRSSDADERLVRATAAKLKLPMVVGRKDVCRFAQAQKLSIEMAARQLRHEFLARTAASRRIPTIALAHHADDQLELFFLRLLRGASSEGLAGMKWTSPSPANPKIRLVRPLLDQPKSALLDYAASHKIRFHEDATNASLDIQRNRIRHELLPLLRKHYQPALDQTLSRVVDLLGADADLISRLASDWLAARRTGPHLSGRTTVPPKPTFQTRPPRPSSLTLHTSLFSALPVAVQRRCLHLQLVAKGVALDFDLVEKLRLHTDTPVTARFVHNLVPGPHATSKHPEHLRGTQHVPSASILRSADGLIRFHQPIQPDFSTSEVTVNLDGRAGDFTFSHTTFNWTILPKTSSQSSGKPHNEYFDADKVGPRITLRHWRPGDRFHPIGMAGSVKLQDIFVNQKVPRDRRHTLLLAANSEGEIFWVQGLRISERFKLTKATERCLLWRWNS